MHSELYSLYSFTVLEVSRGIKLAQRGEHSAARSIHHFVQNARIVEILRGFPFPDYFPVKVPELQKQVELLGQLCRGDDSRPADADALSSLGAKVDLIAGQVSKLTDVLQQSLDKISGVQLPAPDWNKIGRN